MTKNKIYLYLSIFLAVVVLSLGSYFVVHRYYSGVIWKKAQAAPELPKYFSVLDGLPVSSSEMVDPSVVVVMIDNHPDARPQHGLAAAKIMYEAPAEGGITRYVAVFDSSQDVAKVGPVRSARPYFIEWLKEYSGLYIHCGGSPEGLQKIITDKIFDLDEMKNGPYFWRGDEHDAPHNLYTSSENWNKVLDKKADKKKIFSNGWKFGDLNVSTTEIVNNLAVNFTSDYVVDFNYDPNLKIYTRSINNKQILEDGQPLVGQTIVVQYVKVQIVDDYGRKEINTDGSGDLRVLRDGVMIHGQWKKEGNRTRWYDQNGTEINLKPGKTWVEVVPNDINIKIST
ncbi:MAG: DUF3048 domain-containing protein [Candidatus Magasanikbacteria bacterium]|nr:DUF3048 domain-containing protein [Candidatus Magasanikbacteria bacterium]